MITVSEQLWNLAEFDLFMKSLQKSSEEDLEIPIESGWLGGRFKAANLENLSMYLLIPRFSLKPIKISGQKTEKNHKRFLQKGTHLISQFLRATNFSAYIVPKYSWFLLSLITNALPWLGATRQAKITNKTSMQFFSLNFAKELTQTFTQRKFNSLNSFH